jgi:hypothetical protein
LLISSPNLSSSTIYPSHLSSSVTIGIQSLYPQTNPKKFHPELLNLGGKIPPSCIDFVPSWLADPVLIDVVRICCWECYGSICLHRRRPGVYRHRRPLEEDRCVVTEDAGGACKDEYHPQARRVCDTVVGIPNSTCCTDLLILKHGIGALQSDLGAGCRHRCVGSFTYNHCCHDGKRCRHQRALTHDSTDGSFANEPFQEGLQPPLLVLRRCSTKCLASLQQAFFTSQWLRTQQTRTTTCRAFCASETTASTRGR